jgi:hypothetical protein
MNFSGILALFYSFGGVYISALSVIHLVFTKNCIYFIFFVAGYIMFDIIAPFLYRKSNEEDGIF